MMVKIIRPAKEIELCDICQREDRVLETCPVCSKRYCMICRGFIPGCIHTVDVCKNCGNRDDVAEIVAKHAPLIKSTIASRDAELAQLGQKHLESVGGEG